MSEKIILKNHTSNHLSEKVRIKIRFLSLVPLRHCLVRHDRAPLRHGLWPWLRPGREQLEHLLGHGRCLQGGVAFYGSSIDFHRFLKGVRRFFL